MSKLYFRYGTVNSAKTLNLLAVAHNYDQQGKPVVVAAPKLDDRFGEGVVRARAGLERKADILLQFVGDALELGTRAYALAAACILVDEVQFLNEKLIDEFRFIVDNYEIPVICYGLRTDFRTEGFPASNRLFELADSIEEIKTVCTYCSRKATVNMKLQDGQPTIDGPSVELGGEEKYIPVCHACYMERLRNAGFSTATW